MPQHCAKAIIQLYSRVLKYLTIRKINSEQSLTPFDITYTSKELYIAYEKSLKYEHRGYYVQMLRTSEQDYLQHGVITYDYLTR